MPRRHQPIRELRFRLTSAGKLAYLDLILVEGYEGTQPGD